MKTLPFLLITACSQVPSDLKEKCHEEIQALEESCDRADVIGSNENKELYEALSRFKLCTGGVYKALCQDNGDTKVLSINQNNA